MLLCCQTSEMTREGANCDVWSGFETLKFNNVWFAIQWKEVRDAAWNAPSLKRQRPRFIVPNGFQTFNKLSLTLRVVRLSAGSCLPPQACRSHSLFQANFRQ